MAAKGGIGSLSVFLGLDTAEFSDGLTKAQQQAQKFSDQVKSFAIGEAIGQKLGQIADQVGHAFYDMTVGVINANDHLNDLSKKTGIAVETLGGIGFAAGQAGGDLETASAAAGKLNKSLAEAAAGNTQAAEAFKVLGVSVKDSMGQTRSADAVLVDLAAKFETFADGPEKSALALRIFGKAGADIIPLLDDGGAALQRNIEFFKRYSGVTTETAEASDRFNDTLGQIKLLQGAFGQNLSAVLLPSLQNLADLWLRNKQEGDGFRGTAEKLADVFKAVTIGVAFLGTTLAITGDQIGAVAARIAAFLRGDFASIGEIGRDAAANLAKSRKDFTDFYDAIYDGRKKADSVVDPADFAVLDQVAKPKKAAPRLAATGASDEAAAILKKQLDGQVKLVQDFAKNQADALQLGNTYLAGVYSDGLISQREFFDAQKNVRAAALADQIAAIDKEVALQKAFAANPVIKQVERIAAEDKIKLLQQQRADAVTKASGVEIIASQQSAAAVLQLQRSYADLQAEILKGQGNDVGAQAIKNAQQLKDAADLVREAGGDPATVTNLKQVLDLQVQRSANEKAYTKLLDDAQRQEAQAFLDAQSGGKGELETLAAIRDIRTQNIEQLRQQAAAARDLANTSGTDADVKKADDLALALKKAGAEIDPLATKFNSLFEDSFSNAFAGFIDGSKSASDAFKDFANSVIGEIAKIAAQNLAKSLFGNTGGSSGLGGLLSGLFGPSTGNGSANYSHEGVNPVQLATGTNYVPHDGYMASLHEGEAVVPKRFNPAAGGKGAGGGNVFITANNTNVQAQKDDNGDWQIVADAIASNAHQRVARDMASGTGIVATATKARLGTGTGTLPKRR